MQRKRGEIVIVKHFLKKIKKWDNEKCHEFKDQIEQGKVEELKILLDEVESGHLDFSKKYSSVDKTKINTLLDHLCSIFCKSAKSTFGTCKFSNSKKKGKKKLGKLKKEWFNDDCHFERQNFRKRKRKFKTCRTDQNFQDLKQAEKRYKKVMDQAILDHKRNLSKKIKNLKSNNSQEFWKLLKSGKNREQPDIPMEKLFEFFKSLNEEPNDKQDINIPYIDPYDINRLNESINKNISKDEIKKCIKKLKNNKAAGEDLIVNEYIKSTETIFLDIYEQLFNIIFVTGVVPDGWLIGNIKPFFKNKGDKMDPKNYRPITILSCLGKLFTAILSERLTKFSDEFLILNENQCGFRKGYSTIDNLFIIFNFFEILKNKKKKMFCAFIDFEKAFDKVWRDGLWYKLLVNNMNGNMYNIILNMYNGTKSCISYNDCKSEFFPCSNGVRQGENLSPFLFALFMNDLESYLSNCNLDGLQTITNEIEIKLNTYLKLFVILYADDTVLMSESAADLQKQLDSFQDYCTLWKLKVNADKSKIKVFIRLSKF